MHRRFHKEDVFQQLGGHLCVQLGSAAQGVVQLNMAFEHDQRAGTGFAHIPTGADGLLDSIFNNLPVHLGFFEDIQKGDAAAAHLLQNPADFRLEQDNDRHDAPLHNKAQ